MPRRGHSAARHGIAGVLAIAALAMLASPVLGQVADDLTADAAREGRVVVLPVEVAPVNGAARAALDAPARVAADASGLPLLLPADADLIASAVVTSGDGWVAASMQADGLHVAVHGLAIAIERPGLVAEVGGALDVVRVAHSHALWTVSFDAFGMAWALDVECAIGPQDPRCTSPDAARALAATMTAVTSGSRVAQGAP